MGGCTFAAWQCLNSTIFLPREQKTWNLNLKKTYLGFGGGNISRAQMTFILASIVILCNII